MAKIIKKLPVAIKMVSIAETLDVKYESWYGASEPGKHGSAIFNTSIWSIFVSLAFCFVLYKTFRLVLCQDNLV